MTGTFAMLAGVVAGGSLAGGAGPVGGGPVGGGAVGDALTDGAGVADVADGEAETAGEDDVGTTIAGPAPRGVDRLFSTSSKTTTRTTALTAPRGGSSRRSVTAAGSPAR